MSQSEKTEEDGHPSETPLHGQHGSQTEDQRLPLTRRSSKYHSADFKRSSSFNCFTELRSSKNQSMEFKRSSSFNSVFRSPSEEDEGVADNIDLVKSSDDISPLNHTTSTGSRCFFMKRESSLGCSSVFSSISEEDDSAADGTDLVQSSDDPLQQQRPDSRIRHILTESNRLTHSLESHHPLQKSPLKHTASTGSGCFSIQRGSSQGRINTKTRHPFLRMSSVFSSFSEDEDNPADDTDLVQCSDDLLQERVRTLLISGFTGGGHWDK